MVVEEERFSVVWPMTTSIARPLLFNFSRRIFWADQFMPAGAFWGHPHFDVSWTSLHGMFLFLMEDFGTIPHCSGKSTVSSSNFLDPESIASCFRGVSFSFGYHSGVPQLTLVRGGYFSLGAAFYSDNASVSVEVGSSLYWFSILFDGG